MYCQKCGAFVEDGQECSSCHETHASNTTESVFRKQRHISARGWLIAGMVLAFSAIGFLGTYHVVETSTDGTVLVRKVHFTLAESFVSLDAITSQPIITAKSKYPLAIKAMQRDGILETDEQMEERIQQEMQKKIDDAQQNFMDGIGK